MINLPELAPNPSEERAADSAKQVDSDDRAAKWGPGTRRRIIMQRSWIAVVMAYAAVRAVAIGKFLGPKYGIDPWKYFAVDFVAAGIEGWATGRVVGFLIDREKKRAMPYGILAATMFVVPDIYIFAVGNELPWPVYVIIGVIVTCTGTFTVVGIAKKIRKAWAVRHHHEDALPVDATEAAPVGTDV